MTHYEKLTLDKKGRFYVMSRGASQEAIEAIGIRSWQPLTEASPDRNFRKRFGSCGEKLQGSLVFPFWSPLGDILGFEARGFPEKWISDYRLRPSSRWTPVWLSDRNAARMLWESGHCWLVEGCFDLLALRWVVPSDEPIYACVTAGLSFTQTRFLKRFARRVSLVFDMDPPGRKGSYNAERKLTKMSIFVDRIEYRGGKDPGEIWDSGGKTALCRAFADINSYKLSKELSTAL